MPEELPLTERYLRYKRGTEKITSWLTATAIKCADISQLVSALKTKSARISAAQGGTVEVLPSELIGLTLGIVQSVPPTTVPPNILTALTKTIEGRQAVADIYKKRTTDQSGEAAKKDSGHQHFIGILIEVQRHLTNAAQTFQEHLQPPFSSIPNDNDTGHGHEMSPAPDIQMHDKRTHGDSTSETSSPSKTTSLSKAVFVLKKQDHEDVLACLCFLGELRDVRVNVNNTWRRYMTGEITFMLASMATHAALCLLNCAEEEFTAMNPDLNTWHRVCKLLQVEAHTDDHDPLAYLVNYRKHGPLEEFQDLDISGLLAYTGTEAIGLFCAQFNWYWKNVDNLRKGVQRTGHCKQKHVLRRTLAQHPFVKVLVGNVFTGYTAENTSGLRKEFFWGLHQYCKSGLLPTWLVVACQMYIDVADILGPRLFDGSAVFDQALRGIEAQKVVMAVHQQQYPGGFPDLEAKAMKFFDSGKVVATNVRKSLKLDTTIARSGDVFSPHYQEQKATIVSMRNHALMSNHAHLIPIEVGCCALVAKLGTFCRALNFPQCELHIQTLAFVYQAGKCLGLLPAWPDMDFVIATQSDSTPLTTSSADRPEALFEAYKSALGLPGRRTVERCLGRPEKLRMPNLDPIMPKVKFLMLVADIERAKSSPLPNNKRLQIFLHELASEKQAQSSSDSGKPGGASAEKRTFNAEELLSTFTEQFQSEEPMLNFDYLRLWTECGKLCNTIAEDVIDPVIPMEETRVGSALLVGYDLLGGFGRLRKNPELVPRSRLAQACKIMEPYITAKGGHFRRAAEAQSSGYLAEKDKPMPNKVELLSEEQKVIVSRLTKAGSSVSTSGGMAVVHHPMLAKGDLMKRSETRPKQIIMPQYMFDGDTQLPRWIG
ncbi:unnamed protein product [Zymoseptoria tritici ST99CH_1A5]|uniref:DUF6604 domain-containing protein n=1 Tax=Zymoseptoria tritici ST99CH_1A5 TaxID=1276529 RepID=A0A1Y6LTF7_ZYMTR|nr:unnamed protein product [Zymoseptoria tritici ST99CH_1A5]